MNTKKAIKLRNAGHTISETASILKCSRATISKHTKGKVNLAMIKRNVLNNSIHASAASCQKWLMVRQDARDKAIRSFDANDVNLIALIMLYWGEGSKTGTTVRIANSDPILVLAFKKLLSKFGEHKFSCRVVIYPDHNLNHEEKYWSNLLGIQPKIDVKQSNHGKQKLSPHGCCYLSVNSVVLKVTIDTWIELYKKQAAVAEWPNAAHL